MTLILIVSVGVYAFSGNAGHTSDQIDEVDPTVLVSVKDGVSWNEVIGKPSCSNGQVLKWNNGWDCGADDDTVVKDTNSATQCNGNWKYLDGNNNCRDDRYCSVSDNCGQSSDPCTTKRITVTCPGSSEVFNAGQTCGSCSGGA